MYFYYRLGERAFRSALQFEINNKEFSYKRPITK